MSKIPIANIYYLLCYAWNILPECTATNINSLDIKKPVDLFARLLINGTNHVLRRGIDQSYVDKEEDTASLKGRIDFAGSTRRMLHLQGRMRCEFDEISANITTNQIVKATLLSLSKNQELDRGLRRSCSLMVKKLHNIEDVRLMPNSFHRVQLSGNNRFYRFLINVCELIFRSSLIDKKTGNYKFRDFLRDERQMAKLYEKFIFNFYRREQSTYRVSSDRIRWQAESDTDKDLSLLPSMLTDISLRSLNRTIIIDAKYYSNTLQSNYSSETISSNNLYQIYAYLKNLEFQGGNDANADGILLYPVIDQHLEHSYHIDEHQISIMTLDLSSEWDEIEAQLLDLVA